MNAHARVWEQWPTELEWRPMAPQLRTVRLLGMGGRMLLLLAAAIALTAILSEFDRLWIALVAVAALAAVRALVIARAVRAWGYAEREQDLLVRHGIMFRQLSIVPYGRIQLVDLKAGPMERAFGLTTVEIRTAAPGTVTEVPGLAPGAASELRDRLAARAAEVREGL